MAGEGRPDAEMGGAPQDDGAEWSVPSAGCPEAEVWEDAKAALNSADPLLQASGELARQLLNIRKPNRPIKVESAAFAEPSQMCCAPELRLAQTILLRTAHAAYKRDAAEDREQD